MISKDELETRRVVVVSTCCDSLLQLVVWHAVFVNGNETGRPRHRGGAAAPSRDAAAQRGLRRPRRHLGRGDHRGAVALGDRHGS